MRREERLLKSWNESLQEWRYHYVRLMRGESLKNQVHGIDEEIEDCRLRMGLCKEKIAKFERMVR